MTPREGTGDRRQALEARVGEWLTPRWEIFAFLGRGAMSTVYAATDPSTGERVAIKVFDPHIAMDPRVRETFLTEAAAPNAISHASRTLVIADGVSDRGELFLVSELLAGSSLDHYFQLGGEVASVAEKLRLFDSLLSFLAECHARGIVHRDLKPTNLQLTRSGQLSVLDFGIARLREMEAELDPANEAELTSTSAFMAPEQALGLSDLVDGRADLWSVGACIYTLLTGDEVRKGGAEPLAVTANVPSVAVARPGLPLEVVAFVDKSLSYDRACRFSDAQAMRAELNALRDDVRSGRAKPPSKRPELEASTDVSPPSGGPLQRVRSRWSSSGTLESPASSVPSSSSRMAPRESGVAWRAGAPVGATAPAEDAGAPPDSASTASISSPVPPRRSSASDLGRPQRAVRPKIFDPRAEPDLPAAEGPLPAPPDEPVSPADTASATERAERPSGTTEAAGERAAGGEQRRPSSIVDAIRATANPHEVKTVPPPPLSAPDGAHRNAEADSGRMAWNDLPRLDGLAQAEKPATLPAPPVAADDDIPVTMDEDEDPPSPPASDIREVGGSTVTTAKVVGRYEIHDRIASGGMASVHIGRLKGPVGFSRTVAIKRMHPHFLGDPEFVSMFLDEARVVAQVRHPNVVPTLDVVVTPGELFLVLEYVQGVTLSSLLRTATHARRKMPLPVALAIVSAVLHGLEAAHDARDPSGEPLGLVHRDISPQNILVGPDGLARVLDFGVAKARGRLQTTGAGMLKGKLAYMSPEQVRGGEVTRRADVYAASVVLWESLAGRRLFHGENEASTLERVLWGEVPPPSAHSPDVSQALDAIVMRGLTREPQGRFGTALEMATALEELPIAITPVVGRWVREVAKAALLAQATRLAEIESQKDDGDETGSALETPNEDRLRFAP